MKDTMEVEKKNLYGLKDEASPWYRNVEMVQYSRKIKMKKMQYKPTTIYWRNEGELTGIVFVCCQE